MVTWEEVYTYVLVVGTVGAMFLFTPLWAPRLVYARIDTTRRAIQPRNLRNFTMSELACAFVYIGIANALFNSIRADYERFPMWGYLMPVLCNALALLTWWLSLQFADRQGISGHKARLYTVLLFFPLASFLMAHVIVAAFLFFGEVVSHQEFRNGNALLQMLMIFCVSLVSLLVLRVAFERMTDQDEPRKSDAMHL